MVAVGAGVLPACSATERSVTAFCDTLQSEQDRLRQHYEAQFESADQGDPLLALFSALSLTASIQGDLVVYFDRLEASAPSSIQSDVEAVRDGFEDQAEAAREAATNPLGAMFSGLTSGLQMQGSLSRVDNFARTNCGLGV